MMSLFPIRALEFWLWGYTLALIENLSGSPEFRSVQGFARQYPIFSIGLILSQLSVAGMPLLASFPIKFALFSTTFKIGLGLGMWGFLGNLGLFLFSMRLLSHMVAPTDDTNPSGWSLLEKPYEYLPVIIMILILLLMGAFPNTLFSNIINTLTVFNQLQ